MSRHFTGPSPVVKATCVSPPTISADPLVPELHECTPCPSHYSFLGPLYFSCWPFASHKHPHTFHVFTCNCIFIGHSTPDDATLKIFQNIRHQSLTDTTPHPMRLEISTVTLPKPENLHTPSTASNMLYTFVLSSSQSYITYNSAIQNFTDMLY